MFIVEIAAAELQLGMLASLFAQGAAAVLVHMDGRLRSIWADLIEDTREKLPWEVPLLDIARNHHGSNDITATLGDMYYFQPGHHGYIARKVEIDRRPDGSREVIPPVFVSEEERQEIDREVLDECCTIVDRIMEAMIPPERNPAPYRVAVQRLKYQETLQDFERLANMMQHSLGRWGRAGFALDRSRGRLEGPLAKKGVSDVVGAMLMMPGVRRPASWMARRFNGSAGVDANGAELAIYERAHHDERFFTALCGTRDCVQTQVMTSKGWIELPIGLDTLAVFPGSLAQRHYGIAPTLHRVVHVHSERGPERTRRRADNVSLLLGAV